MIQAPQVWSAVAKHPSRYNHTSIKICIIDTGYDYGHEDLPTDGVTWTETIYGSALKDGDGHGTHCAGVIGAIGFNKRGVLGGEICLLCYALVFSIFCNDAANELTFSSREHSQSRPR